MVKVSHDRNLVLLDLLVPRRDVEFSMVQAETLADKLEQHAAVAEANDVAGDRALYRGDVWNLRVVSYDRRVWLRVWPPPDLDGGVRANVIPLPYKVARELAGKVRFARQQASYGVRIEGPTFRPLASDVPDAWRVANPRVRGRG